LSVGANPRIGSELAGYRIERLLGRGGMSVVYLAEDTRLRRRVALKLLAPELAEDERFRERFLRESRLAASLDHPNVIPIYEAGEAGGVLFIAMRYVEGSDLKRLLEQEGRLEPARAIAILSQVANALDEAHGHGLVHRDVKPGNVLLAAHEHVYLSDFGLTKQTGSESGLTETGHFMGTANYVSPEQVDREPATAASDQYALGCVLYECLAGEPPYPSESLMGVLYSHASAPVPSLHQQRPELPESIDRVTARALAKKPEQRYPSCRQLIEDARAVLGPAGETASAPAFTRKRLLLAAGGAVALAAAAAVPAVLLTRRDGEQAAPLVIEPDSIVRIDPATNEPVAVVHNLGAGELAVGEGAVWAATTSDGTVSRIDPVTAAVTRTVSTRGAPLGITTGERAVWVWSSFEGDAKLTEIDPVSGRVRLVHDLEHSDPAGGAVGFGSVWVSVNDLGVEGVLLRIDPSTGQTAVTTPLASKAGPIAAGEGAIWVTSGPNPGAPAGPGWRVDPATDSLVEVGDIGGGGPLAAGEGAVWLTRVSELVRVDPRTNEITETIDLGIATYGLAVGAGSIWSTGFDLPSILRVDPATSTLVAEIDMTEYGDVGFTGPIAAGDEGVWARMVGQAAA
jgi:tRNA A-37 threonylcarbamoyl transferase component Bud32